MHAPSLLTSLGAALSLFGGSWAQDISSLNTNSYAKTAKAKPVSLALFNLAGSNSGNPSANNEKLQYMPIGPGNKLMLAPEADLQSAFTIPSFSLEQPTNRLMVGDYYVIYLPSAPNAPLVTGDSEYIDSLATVLHKKVKYVTCAAPARAGVALQCAVEGTAKAMWVVQGGSNDMSIMLAKPKNKPSGWYKIDLVPHALTEQPVSAWRKGFINTNA